MRILLLADIHGNYPALRAIDNFFGREAFDLVVNCGDSLVYAPFANEVINWLIARHALSVLGNTDKKVLRLLRGESLLKPANPEKRIMYRHTAAQLAGDSVAYLQSLGISAEILLNRAAPADRDKRRRMLGVFHGSPAKPHEFLFDTSPRSRFMELAGKYPYRAIVVGHSHTPFHLEVNGTHFINPGSVGRMFDGNPAACCAVFSCSGDHIEVRHHRIVYDVSLVVDELERQQLPRIYQAMYLTGKKLN